MCESWRVIRAIVYTLTHIVHSHRKERVQRRIVDYFIDRLVILPFWKRYTTPKGKFV